MDAKTTVACRLATALLAGPWDHKSLLDRAVRLLGERPRGLQQLIRRILAAFPAPPSDQGEGPLTALLGADRWFARNWEPFDRVRFHELFWVTPVMAPATGAPSTWQVPALPTPAALAEWLGLSLPELDWFADVQGRQAKIPPGPLRHYRARFLVGRRGKRRLLEVPKLRLMALQRRLLHDILDRIPVHEAAHGFCRGRSVVSYASAHVDQEIVLRFDLRDFFPSVRAARVHALFHTSGYPREVARLLTGLCTTATPPEVLDELPAGDRPRYRSAHLPQGAPTSPALANLCSGRLDRRLAALARSIGARYTRYADDLAFSGGSVLERCARRFQVHVGLIALEEGFEVNMRKSRFMRRGVRQQLAGIVVNARPGVARHERDRFEAILFNCVRHGPHGQNRAGHQDFRGHLLGRIAFVSQVSPEHGRRLRALFDRIVWEA